MAQFSLTALCMFALVAACRVAPHIVGGGVNTDTYSLYKDAADNNLVRSVIYNMCSRTSTHDREITANEIRSLTNIDQGTTGDVGDNWSNLQPVNRQTIRVAIPPSDFSGMDHINPFIRSKRQAYQMTTLLAQILSQVIPILNSTMFLGHIPQQTREPQIPVAQPYRCPSANAVMASSSEERLRSNCPWSLTKHDLGANSYPRYVAEAKCLCERCIGTSPAYTCQEMTAPVTYFQLHSCIDGMALLVKKTAMIVVGCCCGRPYSFY